MLIRSSKKIDLSKISFLNYLIDEIIYVPYLRYYPFIIDIIGSLKVLLYAHYLIFKVITKLLHKFDKQFKEPPISPIGVTLTLLRMDFFMNYI